MTGELGASDPSGVRGVHDARTRDAARGLAAAARGAGWRVVHLDGAAVASKDELLAHLADRLALPAWFGRNWDALVDALREVTASRGLCLVWEHADRLGASDPEAAATFADVVADVAAEGAPLALVVRRR